MAEDTGGEKTLPASAQKIRKAREDGNIAKSQDLSSGVVLCAALLTFYFLGEGMMSLLIDVGRYYIGGAHELSEQLELTRPIAITALTFLARCVLPFAAIMMLTGLALNFAQVGILFTGKPMQPKLNRINPISGMKKFFSLRSLVELIKSLLKLTLISVIVWMTLRSRLDELLMLMMLTPTAITHATAQLLFAVWWRIALAMVLLGMADYGYQRWQHLRDLRMTHHEAKQEMKELEGDPHIKRRVRQLQRQIATQRMMADVPTADVIITNPAHYAIALRYEADAMQAPVVIAKGMRLVAERIRELAVEHDVPIVQKPELARTLHRTVEVGGHIPENLFRVVAEVLSFVYRIDRRAEKQAERKMFMGAA